jgi:hypothetical protein
MNADYESMTAVWGLLMQDGPSLSGADGALVVPPNSPAIYEHSLPSSIAGSDDGDGMESEAPVRSRKAGRFGETRAVRHMRSEQQRRQQIKYGLDRLQSLLPAPQNKQKLSKTAVLDHAFQLIQTLQMENQSLRMNVSASHGLSLSKKMKQGALRH